MGFYAGQTIRQGFFTGVAGETFTYNLSRDPNGASFISVTNITDLGGGDYLVSFVGSIIGNWYFRFTGNTSGEEIIGNFAVDSSSSALIPVTTATNAGLAITLQALRQRVLARLGDGGERLTATSNGTTTTFIDALNVSTASETREGQFLYFLTGTAGNIAHTARVVTTDKALNKLTFTPAVPSNTAIGDTIETANYRGVGFRPDQINLAINNAINDAFPLGKIEVTADVTGFSADPPATITVPANMYEVYDLSSLDADGYLHPILQATRTNRYGWSGNPADGTINLAGWPGRWSSGLTLRLRGMGRQDTLSADTDTCVLNAEYIIARACYHLSLAKISSDPSYGQMTGVFKGESEALRTRIRTPQRAGSVLVRSI